MNEKVSVIVATYHRDERLKKALESLSNQTYSQMEIVLIDDNADRVWREKVENIVKEFRNNYPNIDLIYAPNEENLGSAKTRNRGIEIASGKYVTFLDDDDVYLPNKAYNQVKFMVEGDLDFSVTDLDLYYDNGKLAEHKTREYIKEVDSKNLFRYHLMYHITGTDTMMFTKDYLVKIGGFAPIDVGDEFYLMQRAIENGGKFGYLPVADVQAIVHTTDEGLSSGEGKIKGENQLYEHKKQYFKGLKKKDRRYIKMRHHAVLAFAKKRANSFGGFLKHGFISFLVAPIQCAKLVLGRKI